MPWGSPSATWSALAFYTGVLPFEKIGDTELTGDAIEHLNGVFGARLRVARLRLGEEHIELIEYLAPQGRPFPPDARSNDLAALAHPCALRHRDFLSNGPKD